jgi:hypothetical protein
MSSHDTPDPGPAHYRVVTDRQLAERRAKGARRMGFGALWLAAGLLITIITLAHSAADGFAIIAFGPILGGILQMISGYRVHRSSAGSP